MISIKIPTPYEEIPIVVKELSNEAKRLMAELKQVRLLMKQVREHCPHTNAKSGYDEREGNWMSCDHCGKST